MLRLIQHLPSEDIDQVLDRSQVIAFGIKTLTSSNQVEQYMVEEWLEICSSIAESHWGKLSESGFLAALQFAATAHGIDTPDWLINRHNRGS
jgi:hypothetical protein